MIFMSILINKETKVLIQGITGRSGQVALKTMKDYGTKVLAGVTPGKGGQNVEGVPVYNSVHEALKNFPEINCSAIYVPPAAAREAVIEAVSNGIKLVNVITEGVAIQDTVQMLRYAKLYGARIIGPSSIGILTPKQCKIGVLGGSAADTDKIYFPGSIGVISKSGGMTNETAWVVRSAGLGQSTVVGIGGDVILGTDFVDLLKMFEADKETKGVVIFGEPGGTYEDKIAEAVRKKEFTKPIAAFIAGVFAERLPHGTQFGHAGALIENGRGLPVQEIKILKEAGVLIAETHDKLGEVIKDAIEN